MNYYVSVDLLDFGPFSSFLVKLVQRAHSLYTHGIVKEINKSYIFASPRADLPRMLVLFLCRTRFGDLADDLKAL